MSLEDWLRNGWLSEHRPSGQEIADLLAVVDWDLHDCQTQGLSPEWRLNIAYNAHCKPRHRHWLRAGIALPGRHTTIG